MRSFSFSVRFKREVVALGTIVTFIAAYVPFRDERWSLYAAVCVAYTILVFGLLWSDGKRGRYIQANKRSARDLVQGHALFLLVLILWIWGFQFVRPWLPDWLFNEGPDNLTLYLIFGALGIAAIWWIEQSWLARVSLRQERIDPSAQ